MGCYLLQVGRAGSCPYRPAEKHVHNDAFSNYGAGAHLWQLLGSHQCCSEEPLLLFCSVVTAEPACNSVWSILFSSGAVCVGSQLVGAPHPPPLGVT
jgi:hypothetical protein